MYVMKSRAGWSVHEEGCEIDLGVFSSRDEAASFAEKKAYKYHSDLIVYDLDGTTWVSHN